MCKHAVDKKKNWSKSINDESVFVNYSDNSRYEDEEEYFSGEILFTPNRQVFLTRSSYFKDGNEGSEFVNIFYNKKDSKAWIKKSHDYYVSKGPRPEEMDADEWEFYLTQARSYQRVCRIHSELFSLEKDNMILEDEKDTIYIQLYKNRNSALERRRQELIDKGVTFRHEGDIFETSYGFKPPTVKPKPKRKVIL